MSDYMNDPVASAIVEANVFLLFEKPFFGNLATRMEPVDASKWCKSFATDGRKFYYNREFIKALSAKQLRWTICHLIYHMAYDHLGRRGGRDKKLWDMANDYIVNYALEKEIVQSGIGERPAGALYSEKFNDEMTSEEVYRILEQNSTKIKVPLDEHLDLLGEDGDGDNSVEITVVGDENGPPRLTDSDITNIKLEVQSAVMNAINSCSNAGDVPAGIRRLIKDLTSPQMDWRALLAAHIQSQVKGDYTFTVPSRRSWSCGVILPSQSYTKKIDVAVSIDTSGSMTDEMLRDFLSEVKGIMETFEDFTLRLWTWDTQPYNPKLFTPMNIDEIMTYDPQGGGGTDPDTSWEFMKDPAKFGFSDREGFEEEFVPNRYVVFTDGYFHTNTDGSYCDTLWVIHGETNFQAPHGLVAYYTKKK